MNLEGAPLASSQIVTPQEPSADGALGRAALERRTFAIISHPDAGKTTLTETLLQAAGAIHEAGEVRARGNRRRAQSDWMKIEQQRGISVTSSVMTFQRRHILFNLLDTPGHQDFSEDTYRTLTAVDCAIMVIDAAKGIEAQTRKLFEVCRLRNIPIITFINKVDREGLSPFDASGRDRRQASARRVAAELADRDRRPVPRPLRPPARRAAGCRSTRGPVAGPSRACAGIDDPALAHALPAGSSREPAREWRARRGLLPRLRPAGVPERRPHAGIFRKRVAGISASSNCSMAWRITAPLPRPSPRGRSPFDPSEPRLTGFVFKVQANMDPNHRDRIAFVRVCSGKLVRGMKVTNTRSARRWRSTTRSLFSRATANSPTGPWPATSSAFPITAPCASAIR